MRSLHGGNHATYFLSHRAAGVLIVADAQPVVQAVYHAIQELHLNVKLHASTPAALAMTLSSIRQVRTHTMHGCTW